MATSKSKDGYGTVNAENISGKRASRGGLKNETGAKGAGKGNVRGPKRSPFNFAARKNG